MRISITSGKGVSNFKLFWETNSFFNKLAPSTKCSVIPVESHGMVVTIQAYKVSFNIYDDRKDYEELIKKYLEILFFNKTVGIHTSSDYEWKIKVPNVNIYNLNTGRKVNG